jgi:2-polyprenyl-3-methyl-5-hydroxy-6-metoxy-1,4-benzoquinol methylase
MNCQICDCNKVATTYKGKIRNGAPGQMIDEDVSVYRCERCGCMWHVPIAQSSVLYQSNEYRESMGEEVSLEEFHAKHDIEILDKLNYTGTGAYRGKVYMDVGCGGGGLTDYISGVASKAVLVEPNKSFSLLLQEKGYEVYSYPEDALSIYRNSIEVLTAYDVIEHVKDPQGFMQTIFELLAPNGKAFIGTPTEYPVLRELLGVEFDAFVFSVQHPWVFSRASLEIMAQKCGFSEYSVTFHQRFGIGNLIAWLQTKNPCGEKQYDFISHSLNALYKSEMAKEETAEYLVLRLQKG